MKGQHPKLEQNVRPSLKGWHHNAVGDFDGPVRQVPSNDLNESINGVCCLLGPLGIEWVEGHVASLTVCVVSP